MQWILILCCSIAWAGMMNTGWLATSYYSLVQEALGPRGNTLGTIISRMSAAGGGRSKAEPIEQESARKAPWGRRRATIANCGVLI